MRYILIIFIGLAAWSCNSTNGEQKKTETASTKIEPDFVTEKVRFDSDDPAIWYNAANPAKSLILGTDKEEKEGGLYVFDLEGKIDTALSVYPLARPNNVDLAYDLKAGDTTMDIAVVAERMTASLRVFSLPDMKLIDGGGIPVFEDDTANEVMGIALYTRPSDGEIFAIASRKENPVDSNDYLYQYQLRFDSGKVVGELVRKFGKFSGQAEVEAIAVDNELGYVYYSDEMFGVRKYYADPAKGNEELAVFGKTGFKDDREGITIYKKNDGEGYVLVSDQGANKFRVFPREGSIKGPHDHPEIAVLELSTLSSDGSEVISKPTGDAFPKGFFVAMSDNKTFEIYDWRKLESAIEEEL